MKEFVHRLLLHLQHHLHHPHRHHHPHPPLPLLVMIHIAMIVRTHKKDLALIAPFNMF